jgi:CO/xanthine dehydrogenase FAD-binding subunit
VAIRAAYPLGLHRLLHALSSRFGPAARAHRRVAAPPEPQIHAPQSLVEATALLATPGAAPLGGVTDALVERRAEPRPAPVLVSVAAVTELRRITRDGAGLRIGAAVTLTDLAAHPDVPRVVAEAIATIASTQVRNAATVGGNLAQAKRCWFFRNGFDCYKRNGPLNPCYAVMGDHRFQHAVVDGHRCQAVTPSDLATAFLALDASVQIDGAEIDGGAVPVSAFYTGPGETVLRAGQLITAVTIPAAALERVAVFTKLALYTGDFATASVALSVDPAPGGIWRDVRVVLGAIAPVPWRLTEVEDALRGTAPDAATVRRHVDAVLDAHAHPLPRNAWKLDAATGLVVRAVEALAADPRMKEHP